MKSALLKQNNFIVVNAVKFRVKIVHSSFNGFWIEIKSIVFKQSDTDWMTIICF